MNAPYYYEYINAVTSQISPSTIHCKNTALVRYFENYFLQRAMSVFEWKFPEEWDGAYILYVLYTYGYFAVFDARKDGLGVIPQQCTLSGYNVFYQPKRAIIANPVFIRGNYDLEIGKECELVKLTPNYRGIMDIVSYYSDMLAMCSEAVGINIFNSRAAHIFFADDKADAATFKSMYDKVSAGNPMITVKRSKRVDGEKPWEWFINNLKQNFIVEDLQDAARRFEMEFDTKIGIPNANTFKKERLISDEVNQNNVESQSLCEMWLDSLKTGISKVCEMFPELDGKITVDWREGVKAYGRISQFPGGV